MKTKTVLEMQLNDARDDWEIEQISLAIWLIAFFSSILAIQHTSLHPAFGWFLGAWVSVHLFTCSRMGLALLKARSAYEDCNDDDDSDQMSLFDTHDFYKKSNTPDDEA
jgi:hypothetical protein